MNFEDLSSHLDPVVWEKSKRAHIILISAGTLLMVPAGPFLVGFSMALGQNLLSGAPDLLMSAAWAAFFGSLTGCAAWCALGLLFFMRAHLRWQMVCWRICVVAGIIGIPAALLILGAIGNEGRSETWLVMIPILHFAVSVGAILNGLEHSRAAAALLKARAR